jgi:TRAP-type C4-dicarboxylate transport system substrate-binding protein
MPKGKAYGHGWEWMAEEFGVRTNGRYKIETYPLSSLLALPMALDGLKGGVAEIAFTSTGMFSRDFPLTQGASLAPVSMPTNTTEQWMAMWDMYWEFTSWPEIAPEYKDFKLLWPYAMAAVNLVSKKEVRLPGDLKGMKVGSAGTTSEVVNSQGGAAVHVVAPETYMNLDKGVIEAAFLSAVMTGDYNIQELITCYNTYMFGNGMGVTMMNWDAWNALSAEDQQILMDLQEESALMNAEFQVEATARCMKLIEEAGVNIIVPTAEEKAAWDAAFDPPKDKWVADCVAAGHTEAEALDIYERIKELRQKYLK